MNIAQEIFPPGEFLLEELEARGWSQIELSEIMGRSTNVISGIITGKRQITPDTAIQLGDALGTGAEVWMNLESQYQLSKVKKPDNLVARKAYLYEKFPVREMIKRGWIEASDNIDVFEQQFIKFFNIPDLKTQPSFNVAAKRSNETNDLSIQQLAWLNRCKNIAASQITKGYKESDLKNAIPKLNALLSAPEESRHVAKILSDCGVKYVIVEPLPGSKIDGACFWLENSQPVIAMSLRLDKIDNFWFVLRHEIEHVLQGHGKKNGYIIDNDDAFSLNNVIDEENIANLAAADFCVPHAELNNFVARVSPFFSEQKIIMFSDRIGVHPGVVVGQLQRKLDRYDFLRKHLVKIRNFVISGAMTDGWGFL